MTTERVTRSKTKSSAEEAENLFIKFPDLKNFQPKHRSTNISPFSPSTSLSRSPPRVEDSNIRKFTFEVEVPDANDTSEVVQPIRLLENTVIPQAIPIAEESSRMANSTIANAFAEAKNPATPKFVQPPTFDPRTDSTVTFLQKYERTSTCNGWSDCLKIAYLGNFLEGPAIQWYKRYTTNLENRNKNWEDIKEDFIKFFSGDQPLRKLKFRLNTRKQSDKEDIKNYYYDILYLAEEIDPEMPFETFRDHFENGLHPSYYETYYLMSTSDMSHEQLKSLVLKLSDVRERALVKEMTSQTSLLSIADEPRQYRNEGNRNQQHNNGPRYQDRFQQRRTYQPPRQNYRPVDRTRGGGRGGFSRNNPSFRGSFNQGNQSRHRNFERNSDRRPDMRYSNRNRSNSRGDTRNDLPNTRCSDGRPRCNSCNRCGHYTCNENQGSERRVSFSRSASPNGPRRLN